MKIETTQSIWPQTRVGSRTESIRGVVLLLLFFGGCSSSDTGGGAVGNPLYRAPGSYDFSQNPELLKRVEADPHGYFRFVNVPFGAYVCQEFEPELRSPRVNLHGDAHLEQYAVTDRGRGLTDFDDSSIGPASIDLIRFGVSILLACRENNWEADEESLLGTFLDSYRQALVNDGIGASEPGVARRLRESFESDSGNYFSYVESLMEPIPYAERESLLGSMVSYEQHQFAENSRLPRDFFSVKSVGYLRLGIGSALDLKYLMRVEGTTNRPDDDAILELKEVRDLGGITCVEAEPGDPQRILRGQSRIAYQPFKFPGYLRTDRAVFWIHSWVRNYQALNIKQSFRSPDELREVIADVGTQLGLGHPREIGSGRELLAYLDTRREPLRQASRLMEMKVVEAWVAFRVAVRHGD